MFAGLSNESSILPSHATVVAPVEMTSHPFADIEMSREAGERPYNVMVPGVSEVRCTVVILVTSACKPGSDPVDAKLAPCNKMFPECVNTCTAPEPDQVNPAMSDPANDEP